MQGGSKAAQGFGIASIVLLTISIYAATVDSIGTIPNGYRDAKSGAVYGAYTTVLGEKARPFQDRAIELEKKAYGLSLIATHDPVEQSEYVFELEGEILRLHLDITSLPLGTLTPFERESLIFSTVQTYALVRQHAQRLFEDMIRFIDVQIPGPNGVQRRKDVPNEPVSIYLPNFRSDSPLTEKERNALYQQKRQGFLKKGGRLEEMKPLTQLVLKSLGSFTRFEYVERMDDSIWVTQGFAGHVMLAEGKPVKSAGQIVFLKDPQGQFTMLIVSNASGNYKPDLLSAEIVADEIQKMTDTPSGEIVVTKGEPISTQTIKIYLKGLGVEKTKIEAKVKSLENLVQNIFRYSP